jgi:hypothetical protein
MNSACRTRCIFTRTTSGSGQRHLHDRNDERVAGATARTSRTCSSTPTADMIGPR